MGFEFRVLCWCFTKVETIKMLLFYLGCRRAGIESGALLDSIG